MSLDSIVSVTISQQTSAVSVAGFGIPLIAGYHTHYSDRVRSYAASGMLAQLVTDGFSTKDPIYMAANAILNQQPSVSTVMVGKLATSSSRFLSVVPVAINSHVYSITIDGHICTYTSDGSATVAEICAGMASAITTAAISGVTATDNTTNFSIALSANTLLVFKDYNLNDLHVSDSTTANASLATELSAIQTANNDWYCLLLASQGTSDILAAAAWAEAAKKIFGYSTADWGVTDSGTSNDVASSLSGSAYLRTFGVYTANIGEFAAAALAGKRLSLQPGSETWAFAHLSGVTPADITEAQRLIIEGKHCNTYMKLAGNNIIRSGVTAKPEYIDVVRFIDYITSGIQVAVFSALINNNKIAYTDAGISTIKGLILGVLQNGINVGGFASSPAPTVTAPLAASVSTNDKATRNLPNVVFKATLAGAIHTVAVSGVVSL